MERIWVIPWIPQDGWMDRKSDGWKDEHRKKQYKLFWPLNSYHMFTGPLFQIKLRLKPHFLSIALLSGFKAPQELWNPISKAVCGKYHGSGGYTKHNCLQDWANFRAWQIVLTLNAATVYTLKFVNGSSIKNTFWSR